MSEKDAKCVRTWNFFFLKETEKQFFENKTIVNAFCGKFGNFACPIGKFHVKTWMVKEWMFLPYMKNMGRK